MATTYADEFPLLATHCLYAADIKGDGNCLFNALSDQIFGDQNQHHTIRARVIEHMRENKEFYKQFIDVHPGGGTRRNPKRKSAQAGANNANSPSFQRASSEEIDRVFEQRLAVMAKNGTYGDNMEIQAFTSAFKIDVKIYQHDFAYMVSAPEDGEVHPVAHIAYHSWEHYSSIRNVDGPHTGLPHVHEKVLSAEEEAKNSEAAAKMSRVVPWMINVVHQSLPFLADRESIKKALEEHKCNIDAAVNSLLDQEDKCSVSSQNGSSSTERDPDSDDEDFDAPSKKQNRRDRATRILKKDRLNLTASGNGSENDGGSESSSRFSISLKQRKTLTPKSRLARPKESDDSTTVEEEAALKAESVDSDSEEDVKPWSPRRLSPRRAEAVKSETASTQETRPKIRLVVKGKKEDDEKPGVMASSPPAHRVTAREKAEAKKHAQKEAKRERQKAEAKAKAAATRVTASIATGSTDTIARNPSPTGEVSKGIRTLFV